MKKNILKTIKAIGSKIVSVALIVMFTSTFAFGSSESPPFTDVFVPATWHPVTVEDGEIKEIDKVNPIEVYCGEDITKPERAEFNKNTGEYEIRLASTNIGDEGHSGGWNFFGTDELFFVDKYFHVCYQGDANQYKRIEEEKGSPSPSGEFFQSSVIKIKYGDKEIESPYSDFYETYTGINGHKSVNHKEGTNMDLYVKAHEQELSKILPVKNDSNIYIGINTSLSPEERSLLIKERISKSLDRIEYFHPIDIMGFYHMQNEYLDDETYQDFDKYAPRIRNTLINGDLDRYKDTEVDNEFVYKISFGNDIPFLVYDNTSDNFLTDSENNFILPFEVQDGKDNISALDFNNKYELVSFVFNDDVSDIIEFDEDKGFYPNTLRTIFPRQIYQFNDSIHFPVVLYQSVSPEVKIVWDDNDNKDNDRPDSIKLSMEVATEGNVDPGLPKDFNNKQDLEISNTNEGEITKNFDEIPFMCIDTNKDEELLNIKHTIKAPDVDNYSKKIEGNPVDGYTVTYKREDITHDITYDLNGGTLNGKTGNITIEAKEGETIVIPEAPVLKGHKFLYWEGSKYYPGDSFVVDGPHTFKAKWKKAESIATEENDNHTDDSDKPEDKDPTGDRNKSKDKNIKDKNMDKSTEKNSDGIVSTGDENKFAIVGITLLSAIIALFLAVKRKAVK